MNPELLFEIIYITLALIIIYRSVKNIIKILNDKNRMLKELEMYKIQYTEQNIIGHLDFIITECLDYYVIMVLNPKNVYYINNKMEKEIIDNLTENVSARISSTLYSQLSLIYDSDQIPKIIGEKIYTKVLEYVIEFNVQNDHMRKK